MVGRPRSVDDGAIFDAVTNVISRDGPASMSLAAVAEEVGLTAPALSQRFGSKRGLLLAFSEHSSAGASAAFGRASRSAASRLDAAIEGLLGLNAPIRTRRELANHLALLHLDLSDDDLGRFASQQSRTIRAELQRLLTDARERGEIDGIAPKQLAEDLYTTYNGAVVTWAIDGRGTLKRWVRVRLGRALAPYRVER